MRLWFLFILYGILVVAIKSVFALPGDFLLLAVVYLSFYEEWKEALFLSLLLGLFLDIASLSPFGTAICSFGSVFGLVRLIKNKIMFQGAPSRFFWVFLFSILEGLIGLGFVNLVGNVPRPFSIYLPKMFGNAFGDALLGIVWLPTLWWYRHLTWDKLFRSQDVLLKK